MQEEASAVSVTRNQLLTVMIGRWPAFYAWLRAERGFEADPEPGKPQYCPVHGGESGRAFRFYQDMPFTGGGICNSCEGLRASNGIDLVAGWLAAVDGLEKRGALTEALNLIQEWLDEQSINIPPEPVALAVGRWVGAHQCWLSCACLTGAPRPVSSRTWSLPRAEAIGRTRIITQCGGR